MSKPFNGKISNVQVHDQPKNTNVEIEYLQWAGKSIADLTAMLTHAHQDAQQTGHCHWCSMIAITDKHVVASYTHADDCELTDTLP